MYSFLKKLGRRAAGHSTPEKSETEALSPSLETNISAMKRLLCDDSDFIVRVFEIPVAGGKKAALFFIDGLVRAETIRDTILRPLMMESRHISAGEEAQNFSIRDLSRSFLLSGELKTGTTYEEVCAACLMGDTAVMVDGFAEFIFLNTKGFERRAVTEPQTETVVRGPREGFTEVLRTNTSLIRRKLKTSHLRMDMMTIGRKTQTNVCLAYLDNVANPALIREVKRRLDRIDTDSILSSGFVEEYIEDAPSSVFQTIAYTEKPDIVAAKLLEGRCALVVDGTPFVLTMPMLFIECFHSPEDYTIRPFIATFLRVIRAISFLLSLSAPAIYVAMTVFHQELIPTTLLFTIAAASENTPFNSVTETAIMLLTFEVLKEAGIRLPKPVGQAVSIVGALVMGQAAIQAGLVGAPVVVVIAFTAVSSFLVPQLSDSTSLLRWFLLLLASIFGGFGITMGVMALLFHLASLESFGSHYLYPYAPFSLTDMKDSIVRAPLWRMRTRPATLRPQDAVRQNMERPHFEQEGNE